MSFLPLPECFPERMCSVRAIAKAWAGMPKICRAEWFLQRAFSDSINESRIDVMMGHKV